MSVRFILKPKQDALAVLQSAAPVGLDEGELGITSETNQFVKRPDGNPSGDLIFLTPNPNTPTREYEEFKTVTVLNQVPDAAYNIKPGSLKLKVNGIEETTGFSETGGKTISWNPSGLFDLEIDMIITLLYDITY